jgi:hypothetical protein
MMRGGPGVVRTFCSDAGGSGFEGFGDWSGVGVGVGVGSCAVAGAGAFSVVDASVGDRFVSLGTPSVFPQPRGPTVRTMSEIAMIQVIRFITYECSGRVATSWSTIGDLLGK